MYIHTFAFRWQPDVSEDQKERAMADIRKLQGQIPGLLETYVGENISPRGQDYQLGGVMKFSDKAALDAYGPHPCSSEACELADAVDSADRSRF